MKTKKVKAFTITAGDYLLINSGGKEFIREVIRVYEDPVNSCLNIVLELGSSIYCGRHRYQTKVLKP